MTRVYGMDHLNVWRTFTGHRLKRINYVIRFKRFTFIGFKN